MWLQVQWRCTKTLKLQNSYTTTTKFHKIKGQVFVHRHMILFLIIIWHKIGETLLLYYYCTATCLLHLPQGICKTHHWNITATPKRLLSLWKPIKHKIGKCIKFSLMFVRLSFFFFRSRDNSLTCNLGHSACPLFWIFPACFHTHISILHLNLLTFLFYAPCFYFLYLNEIGKQFILKDKSWSFRKGLSSALSTGNGEILPECWWKPVKLIHQQ